LDQIEINGRVEIENNVDAVADILINDTLSTIAYNGGTGTFYLTVYGTIENNGLFGQIYDDVLRVYVNGGIINKGIWNADQNNLIFFQNNNTCSVNCFNIGSDDMQVNGSGISGIGANSFSIISGGGVQSVLPSHSYDLSLQFTPGSEDTTATLNIDCTEIGSLNNVHLIGHNYNTTVDVEDENITDIPAEFILNQNYPNPFNPSTKISWQSPAAGWQTIKIYDAIGREIETILNEFMEAGFHSKLYIVNSTLPSGVYFFQLKTGDFIQTKKMIFMK
jgi:hypothetical protein